MFLLCVKAMVLRDRHRPSIIMWSIGNEIPMRHTPQGVILSQNLTDYIKLLDPNSQRAITSAVPSVTGPADDAFFAPLGVAGYNYSPDMYAKDHARLPNRVIVATESFPAASFENWNGEGTGVFFSQKTKKKEPFARFLCPLVELVL